MIFLKGLALIKCFFPKTLGYFGSRMDVGEVNGWKLREKSRFGGKGGI